jgi:hypothetical protein
MKTTLLGIEFLGGKCVVMAVSESPESEEDVA